MRFAAIAAVPTAGLAAVSLAIAAQSPHGPTAEASRIFTERCQNCHQAPDLQFATDRAWLDQVNRTA